MTNSPGLWKGRRDQKGGTKNKSNIWPNGDSVSPLPDPGPGSAVFVATAAQTKSSTETNGIAPAMLPLFDIIEIFFPKKKHVVYPFLKQT